MSRQFVVSVCDICGKIDGSIAKIASYDMSRDLKEWAKEGRTTKVIELGYNDKFPEWCDGHTEEDE